MTGIPAEPSKLYAVAYEAHYTEQDFREALNKYVVLIDLYSNSVEAEYARTQIQNMVKTVVPTDELLSSLVQLLQSRFESRNI
ncbi:MAG: hypothetical protein ACE361_26700 [Aureliella sp.]